MTEWTSDSNLNDIDELIDRSCDVIIIPGWTCFPAMSRLVHSVHSECSAPLILWAAWRMQCYLHSDWFQYLVLTSPRQMLKWPYLPYLRGVKMQFVLLVLVCKKKKKKKKRGEQQQGKNRGQCLTEMESTMYVVSNWCILVPLRPSLYEL